MKNRFSVEWTEIATIDLDEIIEFIENENPQTARNILNKIWSEVNRLDLFPLRGRIVPEFEENGIFTYREIIVSPWRIIYRVCGQKVYVNAVVDSRKNVEDVLLNRFLRGSRNR